MVVTNHYKEWGGMRSYCLMGTEFGQLELSKK